MDKNKLNKYWTVCIIFIIVTFLIGDNTIFKRISYNKQIKQLKNEIKFYTNQKKENLNKLKILNNNEIEKLAREYYHMTKQNEDLFIIKK